MDIVLTGTITPDVTSPLATAPMAAAYERDKSSKYNEGGERTARLPRMQVSGDAGMRVWTAYFPATGIRGKLRRMGRDVLARMYGKGWGIDTHRYITIGGVKGSESEGDIDLERSRLLRQNLPFISLFGATSDMGNAWVAGKLDVSPAVPQTPLQPNIATGVRTDEITRTSQALVYLSKDAKEALTERANAERRATVLRRDLTKAEAALAAAKRTKNDSAKTEAEQAIAALKEKIAKIDYSGKDVSVQMPLDGYEYIPPGTPLNQRIVLRDVTLEEAGLFFKTLEEWAGLPQLGAHAAHGCGVVHGQWSVRFRKSAGESYTSAGELNMTAFEGVTYGGDALATLADRAKLAFEKSLETIQKQGIEAVITGGGIDGGEKRVK